MVLVHSAPAARHTGTTGDGLRLLFALFVQKDSPNTHIEQAERCPLVLAAVRPLDHAESARHAAISQAFRQRRHIARLVGTIALDPMTHEHGIEP